MSNYISKRFFGYRIPVSPQSPKGLPCLCCLPCRDSSANTTPPLLCPTPTPSKVVLCRNHSFSSSARKQHCWQAKTIQPLEQLRPDPCNVTRNRRNTLFCSLSAGRVPAGLRLCRVRPPARTTTRSAGSTDALPLSRIPAFVRSTRKTLRVVSFLLQCPQSLRYRNSK